MKIITQDSEQTYLKALAYGASGTGKTSLGVTAPEPLFVLTERQAVFHIRAAATRLKRPVPKIAFVENAEDLRNIRTAIRVERGGEKGFTITDRSGAVIQTWPKWWPQTIVLDSLTDMAKLLSDEIQAMGTQGQVDKDGMPKRKDPYGNLLTDRFDAFVRAVRDCPYHVLFLAEREEREIKDDDGVVQGRTIGPMFPMRKLAARVQHASNLVCMTFRQTKTVEVKPGETRRVVQFGVETSGPDWMMTKSMPPLREVEVPNFTAWVRAFTKGEATGEELQDTTPDQKTAPATAGGAS